MNSSALDVADVPPAVCTVTSTVPAEPDGEVTVNDVPVWEITVPAVEPNSTLDPDVNPVPVTVTDVPPTNAPSSGDTPVTVGIGS